jgi:Bacterial transcriptional activator domain
MPVDLDATRFRELTARARESDDVSARSRLLADALALWRGPALGEVADKQFATRVIARLDEERLATQEDWAAARLEPVTTTPWPVSSASGSPPIRCVSDCARCRCARYTGPVGRARRWTAIGNCADCWPTSSG